MRSRETNWVGRKRELRALAELAASDASNVGVVGPAGMGKSRLVQRFLEEGAPTHLFLDRLGGEVEELIDRLPGRYLAELRSLEGQAHALAARMREDDIGWLVLDFERSMGGSVQPFLDVLNAEGIRILFGARERPELAHVPLRLGPLALPTGTAELLNDESQAAALFRHALAREGLQTLLQIEHAPTLARHLEATGGIPARIVQLARWLRTEGLRESVPTELLDRSDETVDMGELDGVERDAFEGLRLRASAWTAREAHDLLTRLGTLGAPTWWWDRQTTTLHGPAGERFPLEGKETLRRVFEVLLQAGSRGVDVATLLRRGWPDERLSVERARGRVYMAISNLRKEGLGDLVVQDGSSYRLAARVGVREVAPSVAELLVRLEDRGLSFSDVSVGRGTHRVVPSRDLSTVPEAHLRVLAESLSELCGDARGRLREPDGHALRDTLNRTSPDLRRLARAVWTRREELVPTDWAPRVASLFAVWAEHLLGGGSLRTLIDELDSLATWLDVWERPEVDVARLKKHLARAWELSGHLREAEARYARVALTEDEHLSTSARGALARCRVRRGDDVDIDREVEGFGDEARRQRLMTLVLRDNLREAHEDALRSCDALVAMASTTAEVLEANAVRAVMLAELGRLHDALPELDEVVEGLRTIGDFRRAERFEAMTAYVALALGQLERASAALLGLVRRLEWDGERVEVARNRAFLAVVLALLGARDEASREASRARQLAAECEHVGIRAFVDAQISLMHEALGDEARSVAYLARARSHLSEGVVSFAHEVVAIIEAAHRGEWPDGGALLGHATRALCRRVFAAGTD